MICPYDRRPCARPRCAVCPVIDLPIRATDRLPTYDPADFPGFTPEQIRAGLTVLATRTSEQS